MNDYGAVVKEIKRNSRRKATFYYAWAFILVFSIPIIQNWNHLSNIDSAFCIIIYGALLLGVRNLERPDHDEVLVVIYEKGIWYKKARPNERFIYWDEMEAIDVTEFDINMNRIIHFSIKTYDIEERWKKLSLLQRLILSWEKHKYGTFIIIHVIELAIDPEDFVIIVEKQLQKSRLQQKDDARPQRGNIAVGSVKNLIREDGDLWEHPKDKDMKRILIIGGYGVFGQRISERLARMPDIELIIAGRRLEGAEAFLTTLQNAKCKITAKELDIHNLRRDDLSDMGLFAVINACGPYHEQDYTLAEICIALGVHYIDLSDNRAHVTGIRTLQDKAAQANVLVVSGASTVPALSSAVIDYFQNDFASLHSVDYGVTPGNQTDRGVGTVAAILRYVGKPFQTMLSGNYKTVYGWQDLHRTHYPVIGKRWMSNCDIPDLDLFRDRYPTLKTIRFYAGLQLSLLHVGLWFLSWPSRWGCVKNLDQYAALMRKISLWFYNFGSDAGGMHVIISGKDKAGKAMTKAWYVIAKGGDGPYIPATPSVVLIKKLLDGSLNQFGAVPCEGLFTLDEFMNEIADLHIQQYTNEPLYQRYLQERYAVLPAAVQTLHDYDEEITYSGACDVIRGYSPFCRFVATILSLPPDGQNHPLKVHFKKDGGAEHWTRYFGDQKFYSKQWDQDGILYERINITTLAFKIDVTDRDLNLILKQVYVLGLPVGWLFKPKVIARESERDGDFIVNVEVHLPVFGLLVKYDGWLSVDDVRKS